jgi:hypothetical protein
MDQWSYYAYALVSSPGTPAQNNHQDRGTHHWNQCFTCLLPLSYQAELTQFVSGHDYLTFPGPIMFNGRVWHRAPRVGGSRHIVLALVACAGRDINHESSMPFRNKAADGDPVQSALQVSSCSVQASKRERSTRSDLTTAAENAAVDCAVSMKADLYREVDYGELMLTQMETQ